MANRVVAVTLTARVDEYKKGMQEAANATRMVGTESEKLQQTKEAMQSVGTAGMAMGALISTGVGLAVKKFADFDQSMSNVQAATHESAENMVLLREAALDAGAKTVFSADEAAGAIEELAKAGVSTADILRGGLTGALDLAAAGGLGVADAAGIAATALKTFGLAGNDVSHVADLLAAGAGKAMGDVKDLSMALAQSGQAASLTGLSIEETTAALAAFASQGLLGSDAGTSLKTMLLALNPTTEEAAELMDELNLSAFDQQGNFIGVAEYAGRLRDALGDMSAEQQSATLKTLFGNDAYRAAAVLLKEGEEGIREWTAAVDDQGYAAETAAMRLDNLKGDIEALAGALDTALIKTGSAANDTLRAMVQTLTVLVDGYNELPEPIQGLVLAFGAATGAVALLGGTALTVIPKVNATKIAMQDLNVTAKGLGMTVGVAGLAIGGLFAVVTTLAQAQAEARAQAESYADALKLGGEAAVAATREIAVAQLQAEPDFWDRMFGSTANMESAYDSAKKLGLELGVVTDAWLGKASALEVVNEAINRFRDDADAARERAEELGVGVHEVTNASFNLEDAMEHGNATVAAGTKLLEQQKEAADGSAKKSQSAAEAYLEASQGADALERSLTQLIAKVNEANDVGQDAISKNIAYQDALAKVDETIQKAREGVDGYTLTLDQSTEAGRNNLGMLNELAGRSQAAAEAQFELDGNTENFRVSLEQGRQALITRAQDLGYSADQAAALADQIYRIPTEREFKVMADTREAQWEIDRFLAANASKRINIAVGAGGTGGITRATGGPVFGPGGPTDDKVPAWLSNGEHVWTAAEVAAAGGHNRVEELRQLALSGAFTPDGGEYVARSKPAAGIDEWGN